MTNRNSIINSTPFFNSYPQFKPHNTTKFKLLLFIFSMSSSLFFLLFFSLSTAHPHLFPTAHPRPFPTAHPRPILTAHPRPIPISNAHPRHISTAHPHHISTVNKLPNASFRQACQATRYPELCQSSLAQAGGTLGDPTPVNLIQCALNVSAQNLNTGQSMVHQILDSSARDHNRSSAAQTCLEVLGLSDHRISQAEGALSRGNLKDARAWGSAALSLQYDCWSGLKYVNNSALVNSTMSYFDTVVLTSTSNALSMLRALDVLGPNMERWDQPQTERNGYWEPVVTGAGWGSFKSLKSLFAEVNVTVCKVGGCKYKKVQDAVDGAPENLVGDKKYVIKIKEGVYDEIVRVPLNKSNLVFLGDGMGKTVITGSLNNGLLGITTYNTPTVAVLGDGFMASGLTIQNNAGPNASQAVALRLDSDFSYIENCEFLGNQDTLYAHTLRQLFNSCHIEGNVDFVFGNAAAIFHDCTILVRPRLTKPESSSKNAISAHGRIDPAQTTGFAFHGCLINGTDDFMRIYYSKPSKHKNYLGRPWKSYSRTVYINCTLEALINPDGWLPWKGDFALSTLYYGEFGNSGPGANLSNRVPWSNQIPAEHISTYDLKNFLQGDEWITKKA